jgi:hypothetical protein
MKRIGIFAVLALVGCGQPEAPEPELLGESVSTDQELAPEISLSFNDDWSVVQSAALVKGAKVRVAYDADRLPDCRGEANGNPAWSITGYYQLNGGEPKSFEAGGHSPSHGTEAPIIDLTESGELSLWFQVTNRWGCIAYDSNYGNNFKFKVHVPAKIRFKSDWSISVDGNLGNATALAVHYDMSRLPDCRQTYNGAPTWDILAYYRFDGGTVRYQPVTTTIGFTRVNAPALIEVPEGANYFEVWFKNSDRAGCSRYDSNWGQNYGFGL